MLNVLFLFSGKVVSLYSRFDVIVSIGCSRNSMSPPCFLALFCWDSEVTVFASWQNLAAQRSYNNLDMSMQEAICSRTCFIEEVIKCYPDETLETVIDRIVKAEVDAFFKKNTKILSSNYNSWHIQNILSLEPVYPRSIDWSWWTETTWWEASSLCLTYCRPWS